MSPGPVSDSLDPEFGTSESRDHIAVALAAMYNQVTSILGGRPPLPIHQVVQSNADELNQYIHTNLSEREWRLLRFALERAMESM